MRVHHLNCGSLCPAIASRTWGRDARYAGLEPRGMVCHVLLIETEAGLVLVDTGLGTADVAEPKRRLGRSFAAFAGPVLEERETALRQIEALGYTRDDVRHIVPTHLDLDHVGGLSDFPRATVHVHGPELDAMRSPKGWGDKNRYRPIQFAHDPMILRYEARGERWFGFDAVRALEGLPPEILAVPLEGHSRGHVAVAVDTGAGWILHAGDAYFHHDELDPERPRCPPALRLFQRLVASDDLVRRRNQERLRLLARDEAAQLRVYSAHDAYELSVARARSQGSA